MIKNKKSVVAIALASITILLCIGFAVWKRSKSESAQIEQIYQLQEKIVVLARGEDRQYDNLREAALWAAAAGHYDKAKEHANQVLALAPRYEKTKSRWRYGLGVFDANSALGRVALAEGDVEAAKKYLFESLTRVKGNKIFRGSGPKMGLAKGLLDRGEKDTFLKFLGECETSWTSERGQKQLKIWKDDVQAGRTPDFGYKARL